jgi:hypothetical protein
VTPTTPCRLVGGTSEMGGHLGSMRRVFLLKNASE